MDNHLVDTRSEQRRGQSWESRETLTSQFKVGNKIVHKGITDDLERRDRSTSRNGKRVTSSKSVVEPRRKQLGTGRRKKVSPDLEIAE